MEEKPPLPIEKLTLPGRLLLLFTVFLLGGGVYYFLSYGVEHFPVGRYPIWFFLGPVAVGCVLFFLLAAWLLEHCGVRIYANQSKK
jgi:hypothetical protein